MSVELLFDKHSSEYNRFDKIKLDDKLHVHQTRCALLYILNLLKNSCEGHEMNFDTLGYGVFISHPNLDLDTLQEQDVIYLLRCGATYDREKDCLLYRYNF